MINNIRKNFTIVPNELVLDNSLPPTSRFIFLYMASKPDDWNFFTSSMSKEIGINKETVLKYINILVEKGWVVKHFQKKTENGQFSAFEYELNSTPIPLEKTSKNEQGTPIIQNKRVDTPKEIVVNPILELYTQNLTVTEKTTSGNIRYGKIPSHNNTNSLQILTKEIYIPKTQKKEKTKKIPKSEIVHQVPLPEKQQDLAQLFEEQINWDIYPNQKHLDRVKLSAFNLEAIQMKHHSMFNTKPSIETLNNHFLEFKKEKFTGSQPYGCKNDVITHYINSFKFLKTSLVSYTAINKDGKLDYEY